MESSAKLSEIATGLYEDAITWLLKQYSSFQFFTERDIVWTVQTHIINEIRNRNLPLKLFDNFRVPSKILIDLVILEERTDAILVAAEFKYEPDHSRVDITPGKLNP